MFLCEKKGGDSGSVYIFEKNETSGSWEQTAKLTPNDGAGGSHFGSSTANRKLL
jgi:hypothetical protein